MKEPEIGGVETREGRLLTFLNTLQHRVGPFKLEDPTNTANVPCQQQDWWWKETKSSQPQEPQEPASASSAIPDKLNVAGLPLELQDHILQDVDFPISLEKAKELRLELMEERKHTGGLQTRRKAKSWRDSTTNHRDAVAAATRDAIYHSSPQPPLTKTRNSLLLG
ncbi:hypothetical protein GALMADRAFT_904558 [Galerina marginata CBS 339.88]|uniref:DUF4246 domain-containing protein n=1 Tax=Galerina marginata (strain CBS 339.88) TaxID=685588 RepID=A0A067SGP7_GALM3|nr:hypothetical protein GALMADRAFT_904558 [Galerina marginata CBS 339.88]